LSLRALLGELSRRLDEKKEEKLREKIGEKLETRSAGDRLV